MSTSVWVGVSVCRRRYLRDLYQIFVHVAYDRGSVLLRRRCDTLCTSGFVDGIIFYSIVGHIVI